MAGIIIHRESLPDGTVKLWYDDGSSLVVGTPIDPVQRAQQAGQTAAAQVQAQYGDPWYQTNVLAPINLASEQASKDRAAQLQMQARTLEMQGRTAEANIKYNEAQVELRKLELRQQNEQFGQTLGQRESEFGRTFGENQYQFDANLGERGYEFDRGQQLTASGMLANARGAGNAAQRVDLGRRTASFGTQSTALADIAAGRRPQGAFAMRPGDRPLSEADRLSGLLGATPDQINTRDRNDRALARSIGSNASGLARGSLEAASPYERSYLKSYLDAEGFDADQFSDEYARAGIHQGRR